MKTAWLRSVLLIVLPVLAISCHAAEKTTILVMGDSLSSGYGLDEQAGWVSLLERNLNDSGHSVAIINDSISGDTTAGGAARLAAALDRNSPDMVIIELGGNDGLRGSSLQAMQRNLESMVRQVQQRGGQPVLLGMKLPPNYGPKYTRGFEDMYRQVSESTGTPLLPFFLSGIGSDTRMFQPDQIHPSAAAQPIIMETVRDFLLTLPNGPGSG